MDSLQSIKALFAKYVDMLFVGELIALMVKKVPSMKRDFYPELQVPNPPRDANGIAEFMRRSMDGDRIQKMRELITRFALPLYGLMGGRHEGGPLAADFMVSLFNWMSRGRRVYRLGPDISRVLLTTSPSAFTWRELSRPFDAFVIELGRPLVYVAPDGACHDISTLLVSYTSADEWRLIGPREWAETSSTITILAFSHLTGEEVTSEADRRHWMRRVRDLRQGDMTGVRSVHAFLTECIRVADEAPDRNAPVFGARMKIDELNLPIRDVFTSAPEPDSRSENVDPAQTKIILEQIGALVANFLIFLQTAHHKRCARKAGSTWVRKPFTGKPAPGEIVTDAQIFDVLHSFRLTTELREAMDTMIRNPRDRDYLRRAGHVGAHWRRPPGKGHIDDAEKTVHVDMYMTNPANRAPGTLPGGATAKIG